MSHLREALLAVFLLSGAALVVYGVGMWSVPSAYVLGGAFVAALGYLFTAEG